jgi:hypothetical protein
MIELGETFWRKCYKGKVSRSNGLTGLCKLLEGGRCALMSMGLEGYTLEQ